MAATTLLSDNGVTSGITGYTLTGGNDGTLQLQTTTAGGTATTAMTLDASQNVGIGATPTNTSLTINQTRNLSWQWAGNSYNYANIFNQASSASLILGSGYQYSATSGGFASSVPVGWDKSALAVGSGGIRFYADAATTVAVGTDITPTQRMVIDYNGNVGINVNPNSWGSAFRALQFNSGAVFSNTSGTGMYSVQNTYYNGTSWIASTTGSATIYTQSAGAHMFFTGSASAGAAITPEAVLTIGANGILTLGKTTGGIVFNKTGALVASTLNDYEEGTWTPATSSSGMTVNAVIGSVYTRVGRLVTAYAYFQFNNTSGGSITAFNITGLPFQSISAGTYGMVRHYYGGAEASSSSYVETGSTLALINGVTVPTGVTGHMFYFAYYTA